ncbi:hypothetical protein [Paenibacillus pabuli]|uniref:hypothetical protein n=1 Tax=Paenibacillus pabuli TaxID=1472 RepID=UPI0007812960|nr:hypothetical protein [Paenibacillus pabuli]MEC0124512.1 hypothetical protein [Paenibacillus pabuli]
MSMKDLYRAEFNQGSWDSLVMIFEEAYLNVDSIWVECTEQRGFRRILAKFFYVKWVDMRCGG